MPQSKKRLAYIDALRGLTMILVVYQHINTFTGGATAYETTWNEALTAFRMPLFFFISGFVAYKVLEWTPKLFSQRLLKKAQVQLIPTVVFSLLYTTVFLGETDYYVTYYWFTLVLFEFFLLYYTVCFICGNNFFLRNILLLLFAVFGVGCASLKIGVDRELYDSFSLGNVFNYFQFFVLGVLARQFEPVSKKILSNSYINAFAIILFFTSLALLTSDYVLDSSFLRLSIRWFIIRYAGLFMVLSLFYRYRDYFETNKTVSSAMQYIGRHTLDIYMLHYFLIVPNGDIAHRIHCIGNVPLEIFAIGALAIMNVSICLLISQCIRNSKFLAKYLFGASNS